MNNTCPANNKAISSLVGQYKRKNALENPRHFNYRHVTIYCTAFVKQSRGRGGTTTNKKKRRRRNKNKEKRRRRRKKTKEEKEEEIE